jgi:hypothetical protein
LFFALAVPIFVHSISTWSFLVSVATATTVFALYVYLGSFLLRDTFGYSFGRIQNNAIATLLVFSVLYFTNLIPPIPLSLKTIDFYHNVYKTGDSYSGVDEKRPFLERFLALSGVTLRVSEGSDAYIFTAIFAPAQLGTSVTHRWQRYDETSGAWITTNTVSFPIVGGRDGGYRAYSFTDNPVSGRWRVVVETARGQVIGRAYLTIERPVKQNTYVERPLD